MSQEKTIKWSRKNWVIFGIGVLTILLGFLALRIPPADGFLSLTLAPLLLVSGYCIIVPWAILHHQDNTNLQSEK
jgi:uncharacterized membrane protein HdeD (DUF308 family)